MDFIHGIVNRGTTDSSRCLVWTIYLNDIPEGEGETEFLEYGIKVQPKKAWYVFFLLIGHIHIEVMQFTHMINI